MANSQLYPEHYRVPRETVMDKAVGVENDLVNAIKKLQGQERIHQGRRASTLMKLSEIFQGKKTINLEQTIQTKPQTSISPTRPENFGTTPRVHSRVTRNNTPGMLKKASQ